MIKEEILEGFLTKLGESDDIDEPLLKALRTILAEGSKPKVDDLVAVYEACQRNGIE